MRSVAEEELRRPFFMDRVDAGRRVAGRLEEYRGRDLLILGIPRGGVPVAAEVARRLDAPLDIVVARKLGSPISSELAIGAVTANGGLFLNEDLLTDLHVTPTYLDAVVAGERAEAVNREERLRPSRAKEPIGGRVVILVDDGLATGATMRAAVRSVRKDHPAQLVVAVPVGSRQACLALRGEADRVLCLHQPDPFVAVGIYYRDFRPTEDEDVRRLLREAHAPRPKELRPAS